MLHIRGCIVKTSYKINELIQIMKDEISAAVVFITKIVRKSKYLNQEDVSQFSEQLARVLMSRFRNHWYEDNPSKGQGYRCIRVSADEPRDRALESAAEACGLDYNVLNLPAEMTLWVDPREVTCRFGERGTCCTIATFQHSDETSEGGLDRNGNPQIRIPSPTTLLELSHQENNSRVRSSKVQQINYHNDYYGSQFYSPPRARKQFAGDKFHWVNFGAVSVKS